MEKEEQKKDVEEVKEEKDEVRKDLEDQKDE